MNKFDPTNNEFFEPSMEPEGINVLTVLLIILFGIPATIFFLMGLWNIIKNLTK